MRREIISSKDTYEVNRASIVTDFDRKVLYRLYQPLVGYGAISLYFTLLSELEADMTTMKTSRPHSVIFDMMNCTNKDFTMFIQLLEGVGLVKTYVKNEDVKAYIYCLYAPKSPKEFFDYDLYASLLKEKLDEKDFDRVKMYFKDNSKTPKTYEEVTVTFNDIYEVADLEVVGGKNNLVDHKSNYPEFEFNYESFYLKIKEFQIDKRKITTEVKQVVESCAATNKLSAYEMAEIVHMSRDVYGNIDVLKITKQAALRNKTRVSYVETKQDYQYSGDTRLDDKIDMFNTLDPLKFLSVRKNNQSLFASETRKILDFIRVSGLAAPVVNAIIDYCFDKNNGAITSTELEYWGAIMQKNMISDAYDAIVLIQETIDSKTKKTKVKATKAVEPKVEVSVEEDDNYEELLKQFKEMRKANGKD